MGTEVAETVFGTQISVTDVKAIAEKAKQAAQNTQRGGAPGGSDYMNFSGKTGRFTIGQDKRSISEDEFWVVDVTSFEEGWVCWKGGQCPASRMANIFTEAPIEAPDKEELGPFDENRGEGWFQAKAMLLKQAEEDGQQGYLKLNSVSGVGAIAEVIGLFADRIAQGEPCWPVVQLHVEEFESSGYRNFKPIFKVAVWLSDDQLQELADGTDVEDFLDEEPAPKKGRGRARK